MPKSHDSHWCWSRRDEILSLIKGKAPVLLLDDETINEGIFGLLYLEHVSRLFYTPAFNNHPRIIEKACMLGAGFKCLSLDELRELRESLASVAQERFLLLLRDWENPASARDLAGINLVTQIQNLEQSTFLTSGGPTIFPRIDIVDTSNPREIRQVIDAAINAKASGLTIGGFYISSTIDLASYGNLYGLETVLEEIARTSEEHITLILGQELGVCISGSGRVDLSMTRERLEKLSSISEKASIWLDPSDILIRAAGALFLIVSRTITLSDQCYALVELDGNILKDLISPAVPPRIINFSSAIEGFRQGTGLKMEDVQIKKGSLWLPSPEHTRKGHILMITNVGAMSPHLTRRASPFPYKLEYLCARPICQVRL